MSTALSIHQGGALAHVQNNGRMAVADIISHVAMVQEVMRAVMKPEVHYGVIPGTDKPTLYKQGAEVLCMAFRVSDTYQVEDLSTADVVRYRVTCFGVHQMNGITLGSGMGEASSGEEKYKWRKAYKEEFEATPANFRREKKGFNKQKKESYSTFQVRTEPADLANTILKMANKRAKIAMTINVTACGDMFGQDLEDMEETLRDHLTRRPGEDGNGAGATATTAPAHYDHGDFAANLAVWTKVIKKGAKPDDVIAKVNSANPKTPLSDAQKEVIRALAQAAEPPAPPPADATTAAAPAAQLSHTEVLEKLRAAKDEDALNTALDLANSFERSDEERAVEEACYDERLAALRS